MDKMASRTPPLDCKGEDFIQISTRPCGVKVMQKSILSPGTPNKKRFLGDTFSADKSHATVDEDELERLREQQQFLMLRQEQEELIRLQEQTEMILLLKRHQVGLLDAS